MNDGGDWLGFVSSCSSPHFLDGIDSAVDGGDPIVRRPGSFLSAD